MISPKTAVTMFAVVVAAAAATGCGPGERSSSLHTTSGAPAAASTTSAPAAPTTPSARPKPRPVAPRTTAKPAPTPTPTPTPVAKPKPKPTVRSTCGAPSNPYGYNFCGRGAYVYSPAGDVCAYFSCIASFGNGSGYMVECNDGMYSMSGGRSGACSHHSGEERPVYSGP